MEVGQTLAAGERDPHSRPSVQQERSPRGQTVVPPMQSPCCASTARALNEPNGSDEVSAARKDAHGATAEKFWHFWHEEPQGYTSSLHNKPLAAPQQLMAGTEALVQQRRGIKTRKEPEDRAMSSPSSVLPVAGSAAALRTVTNGCVFETAL